MTPNALAKMHAAAFAPVRGWSAQEFADLLARPHVHLLERPGAFLLAQIIAPEAEILTLVTDPAQRRQGHAAALLQALEARPEVDVILLDVAADNAPARALYVAHGFEMTGQRPGYYARPNGAVDAVLMRKAVTKG